MRVTYAGDIGGLAAALRARGWTVAGHATRSASRAEARRPSVADRPAAVAQAVERSGAHRASATPTRASPKRSPRARDLAVPHRRARRPAALGQVAARALVRAHGAGGEAIDDADTLDEAELFHRWNRAQEQRHPAAAGRATRAAVDIALPDLRSPPRRRAPARDRPARRRAMAAALIASLAEQRGLALGRRRAAYLVSARRARFAGLGIGWSPRSTGSALNARPRLPCLCGAMRWKAGPEESPERSPAFLL